MSLNVTPKDFLNYIVELFNIKSESGLTAIDIKDKMQSLANPIDFIRYAQDNVANEEYRYQTGYQKFLSIKKAYDEKQLNKIDSDTTYKLRVFVDKTFNKLTSVFSEVDYALQVQGRSFEDINHAVTIEAHFAPKQIELLNAVGDWFNLFRQYKASEERIRRELLNKAYQKALVKLNPNLAIEKPKHPDALVLENIKKRVPSHGK